MTAKRGYHHGDLRNALIEAAGRLAEESGPMAVTVRAAARAAGVTPTAAYRHFQNHEELLTAAAEQARERLADSMRQQIAALPEISDPVRAAFSHLAAVARGYVEFAVAEPGLFRTAFIPEGGKKLEPDGEPQDGAFQILVAGLDRLVEVGHLAPEFRPYAEITAWSSVHGFAMLLIDGPLREWPDEQRQEALARMYTILTRGLTGTALSDKLAAEVLSDLNGQ